MAARFKMSNRGVGQLLNSPEIAAEMLRRAELIKSVAEGTSPVGGPGDPHPGQYKRSWYAKVERKAIGRSRKKRPVGVVGNSVYWARWVEWGTERVHAHHVLLRAAQAGGD
ncbi:HK97 gp10 family phage protein [Streptomyces sp. NBC_00335]|uniref:HK97 gp10 family phage protein n=1 Tax=unclassified Streptomyces TaxID=2593676 RepID=UPI00225B9BC1|nr:MULTISPECIES: HK97 gp10 family phage protein [unclassified Streptomyces]MCX5407512.1 HK97 gp10 family phage protein [Streptomyces sp. NBC_00086]